MKAFNGLDKLEKLKLHANTYWSHIPANFFIDFKILQTLEIMDLYNENKCPLFPAEVNSKATRAIDFEFAIEIRLDLRIVSIVD